jgi:hypothetical protein
MNVKIRNLGVIHNASIDLKPLTVFIGENSMGKTWAAYTLSAIFGPHGYENYLKAYLEGKTEQTYPPLEQAIKQLLEHGHAQIDLLQFADEYAEAYINDVARLAPSWMRTLMATERVTFDHLQVQINLANAKSPFLEKLTALSLEKRLSVGSLTPALLNALKESGKTSLYFYSESGEALNQLPVRAVTKFVSMQLFQILHKTFYSNVSILPTERTGFINFPEQEKINFEEALEEPEQSEPVKRFRKMMRRTYQSSLVDRTAHDNPLISNYLKLADFLETAILRGKLHFEDSGLQKELLFQPNENSKIEMPIVSSMVKELAPLVLALRYVIKPNEWLIIDEPEMNLHPSAQVQLIEFLAMLVNAGLPILITTHSPYIVDHIANLMQAAKNEDKEGIKTLFYLKQTAAFIPQEKVSVYLFEKGTAQNVVNEDGIIDWRTFDEVSSDVSDIYPQLLNTLN